MVDQENDIRLALPGQFLHTLEITWVRSTYPKMFEERQEWHMQGRQAMHVKRVRFMVLLAIGKRYNRNCVPLADQRICKVFCIEGRSRPDRREHCGDEQDVHE
jgi:hypothetical protein